MPEGLDSFKREFKPSPPHFVSPERLELSTSMNLTL
jgi:hypothetical protein